ncbi:T-complex-associated testis-expressed protein 1 [Rhizopus stolonifer]|uniref:T-complex-associated testis-expressed protein 1 n=1 Tax=Rhizopus stolonifer TaxID=4846 RepID=A0A367JB15_RHIST|nr:T-complex-associated testis-expressed protein 1 [Rhizopus stolonifer]
MAWGGNDGAIDRWVKQLEENDPKLVSLHILSFRRVTTSELGRIFRAIGSNTVLKDLYVSGHALDATCVDYLSEALTINETLRSLNLGNTHFGSNADVFGLFCEGLAANEGLIKLDLENKGLLSNSDSKKKYESVRLLAEALAKNKHLEELNIARNELDDYAVELLAPALTGLKTVNMAINNIGTEGASTVAQQVLAPHSHVRELDLSDNPLLDGACLLGKALSKNHHLRVLKLIDVVSNLEQDLSALPPAALDPKDGKVEESDDKKKTNPIRSSHGNALMEAIGQALASNKTLTSLCLDNNGIETSSLSKLIHHLPNSSVTELKLRQNRIDDHGAELFASLSNLQHLELGENEITAKGFGALLDTPLEYLGLFNNSVGGFGADDIVLPDLLSSKITRLDVGCNSIVHQDVKAMADILLNNGVPQLKLLEMGGNVEDKEMELWQETLDQILVERDGLEIVWKRKPTQMETAAPPPVL